MIEPLAPIVLSPAELETIVGADVEMLDEDDDRLPRTGRRRRERRIPR